MQRNIAVVPLLVCLLACSASVSWAKNDKEKPAKVGRAGSSALQCLEAIWLSPGPESLVSGPHGQSYELAHHVRPMGARLSFLDPA